ncbi:alpha/beta hydrolase [Cryobacterium frigoriphilum]|uniref:Alpha/beta hydrolase n=1 Tax=Cryobacterium frigoriphilum TaxID=1259150 RepID=A0A4R9A4Q5_9MICO|nr:alpha/beta hydrolase [Cryobacterium frigoriphilum]TFD52231.1 alpha/beta hydrolase [Cryobacterium frigoriphilum]
MTPKPRSYGTLSPGLTYLTIGSGEPLVVIPGLLPNHEALTGRARQAQAEMLKPLAVNRRVWWVNRKPGLQPETTIEQIAGDYAEALRQKFSGPVDVLGTSTGGCIALQLAADHPDMVNRLVVASAAYRLSPPARAAQWEAARQLEAEQPRRAAAAIVPLLSTNPAGQRMLRALAWFGGATLFKDASDDLVATIRAEDGFNVRDRLGNITAPTLVIGGSKDPLYSVELFRETAALIPRGLLDLVEGAGHIRAQAGRSFEARVLAFLDATDDDLAADLAVAATTAHAAARIAAGRTDRATERDPGRFADPAAEVPTDVTAAPEPGYQD